MDNCIFCKIIKGEIPSAKVYEDDKVFAFLDIAPFNFGHTLIIPKEHYQSMTIIPEDILSAMMTAARKLAPAVMRATGAAGFNLLLNNGSVAGQEVLHTHLHIIPRFVDDAVMLSAAKKQYAEGAIKEMAAKIAERVSAATSSTQE